MNWEFKNDLFQRDKPELLKMIQRKKSKKRDVEGKKLADKEKQTDINEIDDDQPSQLSLNIQQAQQGQRKEDPAVFVYPSQKPRTDEPTLTPQAPSSSSSNPFQRQIQNAEYESLNKMNYMLMKEIINLQKHQEATNELLRYHTVEINELKKQNLMLNARLNQLSMSNVLQELKFQSSPLQNGEQIATPSLPSSIPSSTTSSTPISSFSIPPENDALYANDVETFYQFEDGNDDF